MKNSYDLSRDSSCYYTLKDLNLYDVIYSKCDTSHAFYIAIDFEDNYHSFANFDLHIVDETRQIIQKKLVLLKNSRHTKPCSFVDFIIKSNNKTINKILHDIFKKYYI
jgi:hypothetical protein